MPVKRMTSRPSDRSNLDEDSEDSCEVHAVPTAHSETLTDILATCKTDKTWPPWRRRAARMVSSPWFDVVMGVAVIVNMQLIIIETDKRASCAGLPRNSCDPNPPMLRAFNYLLLGVFCLELGVRLYVQRLDYFRSIYNTLDCGVIFVSILGEVVGSAVSSLVLLRLLRLLRVARIIRVLGTFRELYIILHGLLTTGKAICWAGIMMAGILTIWAIISVDMLSELTLQVANEDGFSDCDHCAKAFSTVFQADLTLFEIAVLGDNWGQIVYPLVEKQPWVVIIFLGIFFTVVMGLMNLILAVIVDFAADAREEDMKHQAMLKEKRRADAKKQLSDLCCELDVDHGGSLTLDELFQAFDESRHFRTVLGLLDIDKEDLECVFRIMDKDRSGDVSYVEFTDMLYKMKSQNSRTLLMFIKFYAVEIKSNVSETLDIIRSNVATNSQQTTMLLDYVVQLLHDRTADQVHPFLGSPQRQNSSPFSGSAGYPPHTAASEGTAGDPTASEEIEDIAAEAAKLLPPSADHPTSICASSPQGRPAGLPGSVEEDTAAVASSRSASPSAAWREPQQPVVAPAAGGEGVAAAAAAAVGGDADPRGTAASPTRPRTRRGSTYGMGLGIPGIVTTWKGGQKLLRGSSAASLTGSVDSKTPGVGGRRGLINTKKGQSTEFKWVKRGSSTDFMSEAGNVDEGAEESHPLRDLEKVVQRLDVQLAGMRGELTRKLDERHDALVAGLRRNAEMQERAEESLSYIMANLERRFFVEPSATSAASDGNGGNSGRTSMRPQSTSKEKAQTPAPSLGGTGVSLGGTAGMRTLLSSFTSGG